MIVGYKRNIEKIIRNENLPEEALLYLTSAKFLRLHQDPQHCLLHSSNLSIFIQQLFIVTINHAVLHQKLTETKKDTLPILNTQLKFIFSEVDIYQAEGCY
jgi:hypothetical protein